MKRWLLVFGLVLSAPVVSAQTLSMWSWRTEDTDAYNEILAAYQAEHPDVTVNFEAFLNTEYNTLVSTSLQAGDAGDVVQTRSYGGVKPWIDGGYLVPLDGQASLENYEASVLDAVRSQEDDQVFGMPFALQTLQMFYNKAIFEELGLSEPTTWDEFVALNQTLLDAGYIPMATTAKDAWMLPILHSIVGAGSYGGDAFVEGILSGEKTFDDSAFVESIQAVKDLQAFFPPDVTAVSYTDAQTLFTTELAAMFPGGSWEGAYFTSQNPDLELGVFTVPAKGTDEQLSSWFVDGAWAVSTSSKDQAAAMEFVNWLGSPAFGQRFTDRLAQISPINGVTPTDPLLKDIVSLYDEAATPYLLLVYFRYGTPSGTDVLSEDMQKLFLDDMSAQEVATDLQTQMSSWFTPGQSPSSSAGN